MTSTTSTIRSSAAAITLALVAVLIGQGAPAHAAAPPVPTGLVSDAAPLLRWDATSGAAKYEVEVAGTVTTTVNTAWAPTQALAAGDSSWRVRAVSSSNERSDWAVASLSTAVVGAPTPTSPAAGAVLAQPTSPPLLAWSAVPGATSYTVQVDGDADMIGATTYTTKNTSLVVPDALGEGDWYWQVTAVKATLTSLPSALSRFDIAGITRPVLRSPIGGVEVTDIVLDWDPVPGAASYDVQVSTNENFAASASEDLFEINGIRGTRFSPATTYNNEDYYWRVRAVDSAGNTPQWGTVSFEEFSKVYVAQPVPVYPLNGATVGKPIYLEWTAVDHASEYELQVSTTAGFAPVSTTSCRVSGTTYTPTNFAVSLVTGTPSVQRTHDRCRLVAGSNWWKVRPLDSPFTKSGTVPGVQGLFSEVREFTYDPATITNMSPRDGEAVDVPTLTWDPVMGVDEYRIEIVNKNNVLVHTAITRSPSYTLSGDTRLDPLDGPFAWSVLASTATGEDSRLRSESFNVTGNLPATSQAALTPLSPTLATPNIQSSPEMTWAPSTGAAYYTVRVRRYNEAGQAQAWIPSDNGSLIEAKVPYSAMTETSRELFAPGTYGWQVTAWDASNAVMATGPEAKFVVQPLAAVTGQGIALTGTKAAAYASTCKAADECISPATPVLRWNPDPRVAFYIVYVSRDPRFTNLLEADGSMAATTSSMYATTLSNREWAFADSTSSGAYYWHVRPCADVEHCGPDPRSTTGSVQHSFKKTSPKPAGLASSDPAGTEISFSWHDYFTDNQAYTWAGTDEKSPQAARQYRIQVSTDASFGTVVDTAVVDQTSYTSTAKLYAEGSYWWRVQALDSGENGLTWSDTKTFTKATPGVVQAGPQGNVSTGDAITFRWGSQTFAASYDVEAYKNNDATHSSVNRVFTKRVSTVAYAPDEPLPASDTDYLWRVRRIDRAGNVGPWSSDRAFRVATSAPVITSPADGGTQPATAPVVTWQAVPGAATYAVSLTANSGSSVETATTSSLAYAATKKFTTGTYFAAVTARNTAGASIGTGRITFTVDSGLTAIQPPVISAPGGSTVGATLNSVDPVWNQPDVTNTYQWWRDGTRIGGATGKTYVLVVADMGKGISLQVTGAKPNFDSGTTTSNTLGVTAAGALQATVQPSITGTPSVGQTLKVSTGTWSQASPTFKYQWLRTGAPIPGATTSSYRVGPEDAGRDVAVIVTATKAGSNDGSATSAAVSISRMSSTVAGSLKADRVKASKRAKLGITLTVSGVTGPNGTIQVLDKGKKVASFTMAPVHKGKKTLKLKKLKPGKHKLQVVYLGNAQVLGAKSKKIVLYIVK
jgi:large repetitive protein